MARRTGEAGQVKVTTASCPRCYKKLSLPDIGPRRPSPYSDLEQRLSSCVCGIDAWLMIGSPDSRCFVMSYEFRKPHKAAAK
jgi:hypothetical protein